MEGTKKIKSMSFHQYSWNSEVWTTWISLICWHHKTSTGYIVCSKYLHTLKISYDCGFFSIWKNTGLLQWQKIFSPLSKIHNCFNDNLELCCSSFWQNKYYSITRRHFHKSNTLEPKLLRWDINIFTLQIHKMFSCSSIMKRLKN